MGQKLQVIMRNTHYFKIRFLNLVLLICAAGFTNSVAQSLSGASSISAPEYIQLKEISKLPARVLFTDYNYSESSFSFNSTQGEFRSFQQPESARDISLGSYGITSFKGVRMEGEFQYLKELHNGIGWKLARDVYQHPYYLANIRPGNWDNDRYKLNLNAGSTLFGDHILLAVGADYEVEQLARYTDPRPSIQYYNLFLKLQAGLKFNRLAVGAYYGFGDRSEKGGVKNYDSANDSFGRTEYNIITVLGMGSYSLRQQNTYEKLSENQEFGFTISYLHDSVSMAADVVFGKNDELFQRTGSEGDLDFTNRFGTYFLKYMDGNFYLNFDSALNRWQLAGRTKWEDGYDFNQSFGGANFFSNLLFQDIHLYMHRKNGISIHGGLEYKEQSLTDRNASHAYEYRRFSVESSIQSTINADSRDYVFTPALRYSSSLLGNINVPATVRNIFTDYVVSPDFYHHTSDVMTFGGSFQVKQHFEELQVALLFDYRRSIVVNEGQITNEPQFQPGNTRNYLSVKLQFFH